tara:strand:+ start:6027 stop:8537 length:2511 start_codon:yes stop_codon:yes gene_type:complete
MVLKIGIIDGENTSQYTGSFSGSFSGSFHGSGITPNLDEVTTAGNTTTNDITAGSLTSTAKGGISASWGVEAMNFQLDNNVVLSSNGYSPGTPVGTLIFGLANHWENFIYGNTSTLSHTFKGNITASSDITASGHLFASASQNTDPFGPGIQLAVYNTESGEFMYTASSAVGGNTNTPTLDEVTTAGNATLNSITASAFNSTGKYSYQIDETPALTAKGTSLFLGNSVNWVDFQYGTNNSQKHTVFGDMNLISGNGKGNITASGNITSSGTGSFGRLVVKNKTDIAGAPQNPINAQFEVAGNGYGTYIHMNSDASYIGHNSSIRDLIFQTDETNRIVIDGNGDKTTFNTNISASGHLFASASENSSVSNVALYDTSTGQFFYTASNAIGGGGSVGTLQTVTDNGSITSNPITSSANIALSTSGDIIATDITASNAFHAQAGGQFEFTVADSQFNMINQAADKNLFFLTTAGTTAASAGTINFGTNNVNSTVVIDTDPNPVLKVNGTTSSSKFEADEGPNFGYCINGTQSMGEKDNILKIGVGGSKEWSSIEIGETSVTNQEVSLASPHVTMPTIYSQGSVSTGTNVMTMGIDGRVYITGSYNSGGGGSVAGANQQIQFNDAGVLAGNSGLKYDKTNDELLLGSATQFTIKGNVSNGVLKIESSKDILNECNANYDINLNNNASTFRIYEGSLSTLRMTIDADGDVKLNESLAVGTISPSSTVGRIDASNDIVAFSTSDEKLKKYIKPIPNALDKVSQIRGVEFDWKATDQKMRDEVHSFEGHDVGVIAQEIEKVLPEVVTTRDNGYKAVKYEKIVPLLIESIKELKAEIEELKKSK